MAETQEKRTDDLTSGNVKNNDVNNQAAGALQDNRQTQTSDAKNSSDKQAGNTSGVNSGNAIPAAKEILQQAKETAGQAYGKVTEQASTQIVTQKDNLARGLSSVADSIRQMGENLRGGEQKTPITDFTAKYGDSLANQVDQVSDYLEKKDLSELVRDVEVFARRNPAVFIGSAFALGVVLAPFLKSGNPNQSLMRRPRRQRGGVYIPDASEGVYLPEDLSKKVGLTDNPKNFSAGTTDKISTDDRTSADAFSTNKGG